MHVENKEVTDEMFLPAKFSKTSEEISRPTFTYWQDVWSRFRLNKVAFIGLILILLILLLAIFGPLANKY